MTRPRIAVVGGGITGLAAAYELREDADVTIFEASDRLGGKVFTDELDGIQVEWGPDSLLARDEEPINLLRDLGLEADIVEPTDFGAWIAIDGKLKRLPEGFVLGMPASPLATVRSGLLSFGGAARAAADLVLPVTRIGEDVSVGELVRARFGKQVADRIVAPLMSGVRSGDIDEMSLDMAAPEIASVARRHRSLTLGLRKARKGGKRPRFIGLRQGMSSLVSTLGAQSNATIALKTSVRALGDDLVIDGRTFDGVVLAVPPYQAGAIVRDERLSVTRFSSGAVINLVYPPGSLQLPDGGSGVLVAAPEKSVIACTFFTRKWPHTASDDGRSVIRCFTTEAATPEQASAELGELLGTSVSPTSASVQRWDAALPEFKVGHRDLISRVERDLHARPIRTAGAGFLATGLNDCLAHGRAAAREVLALSRT